MHDAVTPPAQSEITVRVTTAHGPQTPREIPLLPGLNAGKNWFFLMTDKKPGEPDYTPVDGDSVRIHNGPRELNHVIATGVWRLIVGDKPVIGMRMRGERGIYAVPAFVAGLGIAGTFRITVDGRPLETFASIEATFSPGSAKWICVEGDLRVELEVQHVEEFFGFVATYRTSRPADVEWTLDGVEPVGSSDGVSEYHHARFTRIFTGTAGNQFLCVWGYSDYERDSVAAAYKRLEFRPFPTERWVEEMKPRWFEHWIGRGLEPRRKFDDARKRLGDTVAQAKEFWAAQRHRIRVKTPDIAFDTAVANTAASLNNQFEYPAFMHGTDWTKYGKINCGFYGMESAGYQEQVEDSLTFLAGTQDIKGRQRYFSPAFALSIWCEEQDFYFVEQVWHHYRWTGNSQFVKDLWPAVRRTIEHGIEASDPNGTGYMTAYYETWNCDTHARGGKCALWTGMAVAALRAAAKLAAIVDDQAFDGYSLDLGAHNQANNRRNPQQRYERLAARSEAALATLWNPRIGFYASAEWDDSHHPRPSVMESNYILWRGAGDSVQKYLASRFIRDNFHLHTAPGVVLELINDAWPILWSHHYVANGDSCMSVLCAAIANDIDAFWPSLRTIANTLYTGDSACLFHGLLEDGRGSGMKQIIEIDPQFLQAVVDGLFGITPDLGENRITLRPSLPSDWPTAEIAIEQVAYTFERGEQSISLNATTPTPRRLRIELPVRAAIKSVRLNGSAVAYTTRTEVNYCRVIVETPEGTDFRVQIQTGPTAQIDGSLLIHPNQSATFSVTHAAVEQVIDPLAALATSTISPDGAAVTAKTTGKVTAFLALTAGEAKWLHPLDLDVREPWEIVTHLVPGTGNPHMASPSVVTADGETRLTLELRNNTVQPIKQTAPVAVGDSVFSCDIAVAPDKAATVVVPIDADRVSPGTMRFAVTLNGKTQEAEVVSWIAPADAEAFTARLVHVDLSDAYNARLDKIYHPSFEWRHDYTGCGVGVDWRDPMPPRDERGYVLMTSPIAQLEYQSLPEGWVCQTYWEVPPISPLFSLPFGVSFRTSVTAENAVALSCTQPYQPLPGEVTIDLDLPVKVDKIYLLTANLTKTIKCYHPAVEIILAYSDGTEVLHSLVPPHNMPVMMQHICPRAYHLPWGTLHGNSDPLTLGGNEPNLAVTDLLADGSKKLVRMKFRCVTSETLFALVGLTLLAADGGAA